MARVKIRETTSFEPENFTRVETTKKVIEVPVGVLERKTGERIEIGGYDDLKLGREMRKRDFVSHG